MISIPYRSYSNAIKEMIIMGENAIFQSLIGLILTHISATAVLTASDFNPL